MNEEEGLDEVIKKQNEDLTKKLKEQQNPKDPNTLENLLRGKEAESIIDEVIGPDEDEQETAYQINRQKLNQSRFIDPNRWQEQQETIKKFIDPEDPTFISELLLDMKTGLTAAHKTPGGPYIKGGAAAGAIGLRRLSSKYVTQIIDDVFERIDPPITVYAMSGKKPRPPKFSTTGTFGRARYYYSPQHTNKIANELVNTWKMKDGIFDFDQYEKMRPLVVPSKSRLFGELFESVPYTKIDFNLMQQAKIQGDKGLRNKYKSIIDNLDFPTTKFQLHHTVPVKGSLPGYDGLAFGSDEWWEVTEILFRNMLRPGNDAFNLKALVGGNKPTTILQNGVPTRFPTPHSVTHKFLDTKIGPSGELFWTKKVRAKMKKDFDYRRQKWQEYSDLVKLSEDVTNHAEFTFRDLYENIPADQLDDEMDLLVERLVQLDNNGKLNSKLVDGEYQVPQMKNLVKQVKEEMLESETDAMLDTVTGRADKQREFVRKRIFEDIELRRLNDMSVSDQMKEIQRLTGMSIQDIQTKIQTEPKFDIIKFIRDNQ